MPVQPNITIVSDFLCPWCFIGKRRLLRIIDELNLKDHIKVSISPFQLYPNIPIQGLSKSKWKGKFKAGMGDRLKEEAILEKIDFKFRLSDTIPNTLLSHAILNLLETAEQKLKASDQLFSAYFEKGEDIGSVDVIKAVIGKSKNVNTENLLAQKTLVQKEIEKNRNLGITAVPSYIINDEHIITGVLEDKAWRRYLSRLS